MAPQRPHPGCQRRRAIENPDFNSGSEAVDTAMKTALLYHRVRGQAQRQRFVSRERAYHGVNMGGVALARRTSTTPSPMAGPQQGIEFFHRREKAHRRDRRQAARRHQRLNAGWVRAGQPHGMAPGHGPGKAPQDAARAHNASAGKYGAGLA